MPKTPTKISKKKKYNARFPPARIKKIMQTDEEVGKVAAAVPVIISRALELFLESLIKETSETTTAKNAKTLSTSHIKQTIESNKQYDFLRGLVANLPDHQTEDNNGGDCGHPEGEAPVKRKPGRPKKNKEKLSSRSVKGESSKASTDSSEENEEDDEATETDEESQAASMQLPNSSASDGQQHNPPEGSSPAVTSSLQMPQQSYPSSSLPGYQGNPYLHNPVLQGPSPHPGYPGPHHHHPSQPTYLGGPHGAGVYPSPQYNIPQGTPYPYPSMAYQMPPHPMQQMPLHPSQQMAPHSLQQMPPHPSQQMPPHPSQQMAPHPLQQMPPHPSQQMPPHPSQQMPHHALHPMPPRPSQQYPGPAYPPCPPSYMPPSASAPVTQQPPLTPQQQPLNLSYSAPVPKQCNPEDDYDS